MAVQIQLRRGTAAAWTAADPTLAEGEVGVETDTLRLKVGDGATAWTSLPYFGMILSVSAEAGAFLDVSGENIDLDTQAVNIVFAGPASGGVAKPAFRALVAADVGTGTPDNTKFLRDDMSWQTVTTHDVVTITVALDDVLSLTDQELGLDDQVANTVFAGPASGAVSAPTFRALVADDIPAHSHAQLHDAVTIEDTTTLDLTLVGQQIKGDVLPGGIKLDDLGTADDNTDLDATDGHHGLLPKLSGVVTTYLRGDGTYAVPPGGPGGGPASVDPGLAAMNLLGWF